LFFDRFLSSFLLLYVSSDTTTLTYLYLIGAGGKLGMPPAACEESSKTSQVGEELALRYRKAENPPPSFLVR
jgi:hypothetical protein